MTEVLASSEFVKIEVDLLPQPPTLPIRTLASLGGMWKDNELFDDFVDAMQQYREEVDARDYESKVENIDVCA